MIVTGDKDAERALAKVGAGLRRILPSGRSLDVWPLGPRDTLLPMVRGTGVVSANALSEPAYLGASAAIEFDESAASSLTLLG